MKEYKYKKLPVPAGLLLKRMKLYQNHHSVLEDFEETYNDIMETEGSLKAKYWCFMSTVRSLTGYLKFVIQWSLIMFRNYMKITFRNLKRQKGFSLINILGLAAGLASCIYILMFVRYEMSYDSYHKDAGRIFRVAKLQKTEGGEVRYASSNIMLGPILKENYAEIEHVFRISGVSRDCPVRSGQKLYKEKAKNIMYLEEDFLNVLSIPFVYGDPSTALNRPFTAILTEAMAEKYYGDTNPVGSTLTIDTTGYEITGVIKNLPGNTHFRMGIGLSWKTVENAKWTNEWGHKHVPTYIKLAAGIDVEQFEEKTKLIVHKYIGEELNKKNIQHISFLQRLEDIHLYSNLFWEISPPGNPVYLYIFSAAGLFILLIAGMNFMNLSTARSANRSIEVGVRKVSGAGKKQLIWQFLGESLFLTIIAFIIAVLLLVNIIPYFNNIAGIRIPVKNLLQPDILAGMFTMVLILGFGAGAYPAFFLSGFNPVSVTKGILSRGSKSSMMRKILVVGQFSFTIILLTGSLVFFSQLNYMKNTDLGFSRDQKLIIEFPGRTVNINNYNTVRNEFLKNPSVSGVTVSSSVPGRWNYQWNMFPTGKRDEFTRIVNVIEADYNFLEEYSLEVIAGETFKKRLRGENETAKIILNETAVNIFEMGPPEEAVGKTLNTGFWEIIGVMKDFHSRGLQGKIEPLFIFNMRDDFRYITLNLNTQDYEKTISSAKKIHEKLFPDKPMDYFFLDTDFDLQYRSEERLSRIFNIFTLFGVFIACLGLFGLASFMAEKRTKEIGIRKVLGASVPGITLLMTKEFTKWALISNIISWPLAYFAINRWLQDFAYRVDITITPFLISAILTMLIAVITVIYQALKAALSDPVDSLRCE